MKDLFDDVVVPPVPTQPSPPEAALARAPEDVALAQILPDGFDLRALLTFLPDVRLKRELEALAEAAAAVDVATDFGLRRADALLVQIDDKAKEIEACFDLPTSLANQLHKRMTGLRGDFLRAGLEAKDDLASRVKNRQREIARADEEARQRAQAEADREAREAAAAAAKLAEAEKQPKSVVKELKQQAKTATAPPVSLPSRSPLKQTKVAQSWKACPAGTTDADDPNPEMADATPAQLEGIRALMRACLDGAPGTSMTMFEVRWPALNARAVNERTAMRIPGIEARDVGRLSRRRT